MYYSHNMKLFLHQFLCTESAPRLLLPLLEHLYLCHCKSPTSRFDTRHPKCGTSFILPFTVFQFLIHPILHISLSSSITLSIFHPGLKTHLFHKHFSPYSFGLDCLSAFTIIGFVPDLLLVGFIVLRSFFLYYYHRYFVVTFAILS